VKRLYFPSCFKTTPLVPADQFETGANYRHGQGNAVQLFRVNFRSLQKFAALPGDTLVCCGHEYTQANARFAVHVDPHNIALRDRAAEVDRLRAAGQATVPTRLSLELETNPFLRAPDAATLGKLRAEKDGFR